MGTGPDVADSRICVVIEFPLTRSAAASVMLLRVIKCAGQACMRDPCAGTYVGLDVVNQRFAGAILAVDQVAGLFSRSGKKTRRDCV